LLLILFIISQLQIQIVLGLFRHFCCRWNATEIATLRIHKLNPGIDRSIDLSAAASPAADPEACKRRSEDRQNPIPEDSGSLVSDRMWSNRSRGRTLINNNTKHNNYRKFETYIFINK
jgi:hypothetical protein